jgi:hypothetical protein
MSLRGEMSMNGRNNQNTTARQDTTSRTKGLPPKRKPKKSLRLDRVHPADFRKYDLAFFCEDCSHFDSSNRRCSMGFPAQYQREPSVKIYELTGALPICRTIEID